MSNLEHHFFDLDGDANQKSPENYQPVEVFCITNPTVMQLKQTDPMIHTPIQILLSSRSMFNIAPSKKTAMQKKLRSAESSNEMRFFK